MKSWSRSCHPDRDKRKYSSTRSHEIHSISHDPAVGAVRSSSDNFQICWISVKFTQHNLQSCFQFKVKRTALMVKILGCFRRRVGVRVQTVPSATSAKGQVIVATTITRNPPKIFSDWPPSLVHHCRYILSLPSAKARTPNLHELHHFICNKSDSCYTFITCSSKDSLCHCRLQQM